MSSEWVEVTEADQVTPEILEAAESIYDGWFAHASRVDWPEFLDRLEGQEFDSIGGRLDLGDSLMSPATRRIKAHIRDYRKR
ncbi:hypothetical protein [Micromonospora avicenniae]|uniref:hypothetical protein n=1 Tax=Micromonospora avicenniae TaxID=1198245 RepID=UPI0033292041